MKPPELNPETEESLPSRRSPEGPDPPVLTEVTPTTPSEFPPDLESVEKKMDQGRYNSVVNMLSLNHCLSCFDVLDLGHFQNTMRSVSSTITMCSYCNDLSSNCTVLTISLCMCAFVHCLSSSWNSVMTLCESFRQPSTVMGAILRAGKPTAWSSLSLFG